jgi:predicted DNA-binding protein (MmcQ/YjbR family)
MARHELDAVREAAAAYPGAERAFLFGDHEVYRVREKVFIWLGDDEEGGGTYVSVKLKDTQGAALTLPFTRPAGYGMSKWGWVDARFPRGKMPVDLVLEWMEESYRHTAPKKLLKLLEADPKAEPEPRKPTGKSKAKAKPRQARGRAGG